MDNQALKVLIDGRKLGHGGIGVYTENLIAGLIELGLKDKLDLAVLGSKETVAQYPWQSQVSLIEDQTALFSLKELFAMGRRLSALGRIFHTPHYILPFGMTVPACITVHDLIHITHPQRFYYPAVARLLIASGVKRAQAVFTVSEASASDITRYIPGAARAEEKIHIIPNAIGPRLKKSGEVDTVSPYIFAVISMDKPHKGGEELVRAFDIIKHQAGWPKLRLVIAGKGSVALKHAATDPQIELLSHVSDQQLSELYSRAALVVVPSRAEGFCLPAIEAQSMGSIVVATPVPALQSLLTHFDIVAHGFSPEALAQAIADGLQQVLGRGLRRNDSEKITARYSRRCRASEYLRYYREIAFTKTKSVSPSIVAHHGAA